MDFGKLASPATHFATFYAGTKKSLLDFRPHLLEQPIIKIRLQFNFNLLANRALWQCNFHCLKTRLEPGVANTPQELSLT